MGCQRSGIVVVPTTDGGNAALDIDLFLDDTDIRKVDAAIAAGASGAGVYWALVNAGVISAGAISAPFAAVLGGFVGTSWAWVKWSNSGNGSCGVIIEATITTQGPTWYWINSQ